MGKPYNNQITLLKLFAIVLIAVLWVADFYTLINVFHKGGRFEIGDARLYAGVLALILEGVPLYMGIAVSEKNDDTCYIPNDRKANKGDIKWAFFVTCIALIVVAALRGSYVYDMVRTGKIKLPKELMKFLSNCFLVISPALTSVAAYVVSSFAFRSSYLKKIEKQEHRWHKEYLYWQRRFQMARTRFCCGRDGLAASLGITKPSEHFDEFRLDCFQRIRAKLVDNCIVAYPTQMERFTKEVEQALNEYIVEMEKYTTVPHEIRNIKVEDIIRKYEEQNKHTADAWDYDVAGAAMNQELIRTLDVAIVTAEFKTAVEPYHFKEKL